MFSPKQIMYLLTRVKRGIRPRFARAVRAAKARPLSLLPEGRSLRYAVVNDRGTRVADIALEKPSRGILRVSKFESMLPRGTFPAGSVRELGRQVMGYWQPKARKLARAVGGGYTRARIGAGRSIPTVGMPEPPPRTPQEISVSHFGRKLPSVMMSKLPKFGRVTPGLRLPTPQEIEKGTWTLGTGQERAINYPKRMSRQDFRTLAWNIYDYARKQKFVGTARHRRLADKVATGVSTGGRRGNRQRVYDAIMTGTDRPTIDVRHTKKP